MSKQVFDFPYDLQTYLLSYGSVADRLRLLSAGFAVSHDETEQLLAKLEGLLNKDGGIPFGLKPGHPSSVKETAEVLMLLKSFRASHSRLIDKMTHFLISRQKRDGGFAEALNLDRIIEDRYGGTVGRAWFPVGKSITWLTGKALEALCNVSYPDENRIRKARDYLMHLQNEDGHWPDFKGQNESDPLGTGNILPALTAAGVDPTHKVYEGGRAALMQHLKRSLEQSSTQDMVDLVAVCAPKSELEREVIRKGIELVLSTQNKDGGWSQMGSKKSDPELTSLLAFAIKKCTPTM